MNPAPEGAEDLKRSAVPQHKPTGSSIGPDEEHGVRKKKDILHVSIREEEPVDEPPMAPKNTTQFLMDDKEERPDLCTDPMVTREEFVLRNYLGDVEQYHRERMQTMTERELKKEVLELNRRLAQVEEENLQLKEAVETQGQCLQSFVMRLRELERDVERLVRYNQVILQSHKSRDEA